MKAKIYVDPNDSKGFRFYLKSGGEDGEEKDIKLNRILQIGDSGELKTKDTFDGKNVYFITPETIFLLKNSEMFEKTKAALEKNPQGVLIFPGENKDIYITDEGIEIKNLQINVSKTKAKNDLKAYETPEKFFDFVAKILHNKLIRMFIDDNILQINTTVMKNKKIVEEIMKNEYELFEIQSSLTGYIFAGKKNKIITVLEKYPVFKKIEKLKEILNNGADLSYLKEGSKKDKFLPLKLSKIGLFDPQAGSGAILRSFKKNGLDSVLFGTELREIKDVKDDDYKVITGINYSLYKHAVSFALNSKSSKLGQNFIYYLNPPYTIDDSVAKESVLNLPSNAFTIGLFPVKLKKFLSNTFDGFLFDIPKEMTGYTDPNTPERFLFLYGQKARDNDLFNKIKYYYVSSYKEIEDILSNGEKWFIDEKLEEIFTYYRQERNFDGFKSLLEKEIDKYKKIYSDISVLKEKLNNKSLINSFFSPIEYAKKGKIFTDIRFYGEEKKLSFFEVIEDLTLLNFYKNVMPQTFKLIEKIADELEISLPKMEENFREYTLGKRYNGKKDLVTNKNLGMMKLYYYPDVIKIDTPEAKEILKSMVLEVFEEKEIKLAEEERILFSEVLKKADRLIFKNEKDFSLSEGISFNREIYVLADKYGFDIAKLNIDVNDFFKKLKEYNLFDFDDFVTEVQISDEKLKIVIDRFIEYIENAVIDSVVRFNFKQGKFDGYDFESDYELVKSKVLDDIYSLRNKNIKELLKFANDYNLNEFFQEKIIFPDFKRPLKKEIEKTFPIDDDELKKKIYNLIVEMYQDREITFYRNERVAFFNELKKKLKNRVNIKEEDYETFMLAVTDVLTERYRTKEAIFTGFSKLALILRSFARLKNTADFSKQKEIFVNDVFIKSFGLKPHQAKEAFNYLELSDRKKLEMMFWEMRAGKTRAMLATGFLLSLLKNEKFHLFLETANIFDISQQVLESFPFLFINTNFYTPSDNLPLTSVYSTIMKEEIIPNIPVYAQKYLIGKGDDADKIRVNFYKEFMEIKDIVDKDLQKYEKTYKNSDFAEILEVCGEH